MKKTLKTTIITAVVSAMSVVFPSCVNEWPHPEDLEYAVTLKVHCETDWSPDYYMDMTRAEAYEIEYKFQIFKDGDFGEPFREFTLYTSDQNRPDFNVDLELYRGDYTVYVWSDYVNPETGSSLYYETEDFAAITYRTPYTGNSNYKDAFRGSHSFKIEDSMYLHPTATETIILNRPLGRYIFIADDLETFVSNEDSKGRLRHREALPGESGSETRNLEEELSDYTVRIYYPLYMPAVFNNYTDEPYDSWTGVSYEGKISPLSDSEASLGFDFVMLPETPSSVQVALEIYDGEGERIGGVSTLTVPLERDRTTVITGHFLTSQEDAGVAINPDFDGQYNIKYQ